MNNKIEIAVNQHYFSQSLVEMMTLANNKAKEYIENNKNISKDDLTAYNKLIETSGFLMTGFTDDKFDQGRIIKKLYKTLSAPAFRNKIIGPEEENNKPDISLFNEKNAEGKIITIIPGVNIGLITHMLDPEEQTKLWGHLYVMYISAIKMISEINKHKKDSLVYGLIPMLQKRVTNMGLVSGKDKKLYNPYIEVSNNNIETLDINNISKTVGKYVEPSADGGFNIENIIGLDKLNESLKNIKEEDIEEATQNITNMLGGKADKDIGDVCSTLVKGIVEELQENGLSNLMQTAKTVANKMKGKIDKTKMEKTANQLGSFVAENADLSNLQGVDGNPIDMSGINEKDGAFKLMAKLLGNQMVSGSTLTDLMKMMGKKN
jgi:hypothetical protein